MILEFKQKYKGFSESQIIETNISTQFNLNNINPVMIKGLLELELQQDTLFGKVVKFFDLQERGSWKYIHFIVMFNAKNILKLFIEEQKVELEAQTDNGWTPLLLACRLNDMETLKYILNNKVKNCDINGFSPQRGSALHIAVRYKKFDLLE